ncbi:MAG: carbohydrate-binding protein [Cytophagaceae bacterium]
MKNKLLLAFTIFISMAGQAQPPVKICTWKNNATGCYNIIHDDFGDYGVIGIINYADTMAHNRGIKITFGAISGSCEANNAYPRAKQMIEQRGHEIINHSHTHSCAVTNENCGGIGPNHGWAVPGSTLKLDQEIDRSTTSIATNTGYTPRYYIYPYDQFNETANEYLKTKGYIGSRTGPYNQAAPANFTPDAEGFFRSHLVVDVVNNVAVNLNSRVDEAINTGGWVNRELHNVGNSGWGHVTVDNYRTHLNYVKSKMDSGELWVGTISEILTYRIQRMVYTPVASVNNGTITVNWNSTGSINVANYLQPLHFKSPITLEVDISSYPGNYTVTQNANVIQDRFVKNNRLYVNVFPHLGPVVLSPQTCPVCIVSHPQNTTINSGATLTLSVTAQGTGNLSYQWYKGGTIITGATSATYTVNNTNSSHAGTYHVVVSNGVNTATSNNAVVTVHTRTPFANNVIPGRIQSENFDAGGQGITYNESTGTNQGNTSYRSEPVDIENCTEGGYNVGYITNGEWLEYSVNIVSSGWYRFGFRIASQNVGGTNGSFNLQMGGNIIINTTTVPYTGGWQTWQTVQSDLVFLNAGTSIMRFTAATGNFNINYIDAALVTSTTSDVNAQKLIIYPNPVKDILYFGEINSGIKSAEIADLTGKAVRSITENELINLDVSDLQKGIYLLKAETQNGTMISRFVKE